MSHIIEILRLKYEARLSHEKIARAVGLSKGAVGKYVSMATAVGITEWPLPDGTDERALEKRLFPPRSKPSSRYVEPDWFEVASRAQTQRRDVAAFVGRTRGTRR